VSAPPASERPIPRLIETMLTVREDRDGDSAHPCRPAGDR
jgi:hypothetical protein